MEQVLEIVRGPQATSTVVMWSVAGIAALIGLVEGVRPSRRGRPRSRAVAVALPTAVTVTLLLTPVLPTLRGTPLEVVAFARAVAFWATVVTAPLTVGQLLSLRPPPWLQRVHLTLAVVHLVLWVGTDLVWTHPDSYRASAQFGPLTVALLLPVAALAGWWLLAALQRVPTTLGLVVFAAGGSTTALALVVGALVLDPVLADHMLSVAYLPVLGGAWLAALRTP